MIKTAAEQHRYVVDRCIFRDRTSDLGGLRTRAINVLDDAFYAYDRCTTGFQKPNKRWVRELLCGEFLAFTRQPKVGKKVCQEICVWAGLPYPPPGTVFLDKVKRFETLPLCEWVLAAAYDYLNDLNYFLERNLIDAVSVSCILSVKPTGPFDAQFIVSAMKVTSIDNAATTYIKRLYIDFFEVYNRINEKVH